MENLLKEMPAADTSLELEPIKLSDKLAFLACYSQYVIALQSQHQEQQALQLFNACNDVCPVAVMAAADLGEGLTDLYVAVNHGFGVTADNPEAGLAQFVRSQTVRPLLILTGCEHVAERQLAMICALAGKLGFGLTLFSQTSLARKLGERVNNVLHTTVRKLDARDVKQLLHQRARQEVKVSDSDIDRVLSESQSDLQKADSLLAELTTIERRNLGLPLAHMSMLILFLAVVVGGFALIPKDNTAIQTVAIAPKHPGDEVEQVSTRANANAPLINKGAGTSAVTDDGPEADQQSMVTSMVTKPEPAALAKDPAVEENLPQPKPEPVQEAIAKELSAPVQLANEDPNAWINNLPATAAGTRRTTSQLTPIEPGRQLQREVSALTQAAWLQQADPAAYTLQILGSHDEGSIRTFMAKHPGLEHFGYFETRHLNQPWFVLTYGRYADRDAAVNAIPQLEAALRAQKPWARGVRTIRGS